VCGRFDISVLVASIPINPYCKRESKMRKILLLASVAVISTIDSVNYASAMQFWVAPNGAIVAEKEIVDGDAERLEQIIPKITKRDNYENIPMFLNSPGGYVKAAMEMVKVMDKYHMTAIVGPGAVCASACASILYISADFHIVIGTGTLGFHTCYLQRKDDAKIPDSFCNELTAQNAADHGTSYGAVHMWMTDPHPSHVAWIGAEVACKFGLCGPPVHDPPKRKGPYKFH
jgi:hypothetical protein